MPFRDEGARPAGFGPQSAEYEADSRDVLPGAYESVVVAPPNEALSATVSVSQSPLALRAVRQGESVHASFTNLTSAPVEAVVGMHLDGAARLETRDRRRLGPAADSVRRAEVVSRRGGRRRDGPRAVGPVHRLRPDAVRFARSTARQAAAQLRLRPPAGGAARGPWRCPGDARALPRLRRLEPATSGGASAPRSGSMPTRRSSWPVPIPVRNASRRTPPPRPTSSFPPHPGRSAPSSFRSGCW